MNVLRSFSSDERNRKHNPVSKQKGVNSEIEVICFSAR